MSERTCSSTVTVQQQEQQEEKVVHIVVRPRKRVVWDESVFDNEFSGHKSSKS